MTGILTLGCDGVRFLAFVEAESAANPSHIKRVLDAGVETNYSTSFSVSCAKGIVRLQESQRMYDEHVLWNMNNATVLNTRAVCKSTALPSGLPACVPRKSLGWLTFPAAGLVAAVGVGGVVTSTPPRAVNLGAWQQNELVAYLSDR